MSNTDNNPNQDLDRAILRGDRAREAYILQRLRTRRRMAIAAFIQFMIGGAALIFAGLLVPGYAHRINDMGMFISIYFTTIAGVVSMYWGLGTYERGNFGGGYTGYGAYGTGNAPPQSTSVTAVSFTTQNDLPPPPPQNEPMSHPHLTKMPHEAG